MTGPEGKMISYNTLNLNSAFVVNKSKKERGKARGNDFLRWSSLSLFHLFTLWVLTSFPSSGLLSGNDREVHGTNWYYPEAWLAWKMRIGWNDKYSWAVKLHGWRELFAIRWRPRATAWASVRPCGSLEILACDFRQHNSFTVLLRAQNTLGNCSWTEMFQSGQPALLATYPDAVRHHGQLFSGAARLSGVLPSPGLTPSLLGRCGWRG